MQRHGAGVVFGMCSVEVCDSNGMVQVQLVPGCFLSWTAGTQEEQWGHTRVWCVCCKRVLQGVEVGDRGAAQACVLATLCQGQQPRVGVHATFKI